MNKFIIKVMTFGCALAFASPAWSKPPHLGTRADRNHDGHVGPVERHKAIDKRNDVNTRKEAHWDTDNNGQVDKHEAKARVNSRWENKVDKNNDGIVEPVEVSSHQ